MIRCETPEHQKSMHFMESEAESFARYLLDNGIQKAVTEIDNLNEELRAAAIGKKGKTHWDEYHSLAIRNIFELRRVVNSMVSLRDCVNSHYGNYCEAQVYQREQQEVTPQLGVV